MARKPAPALTNDDKPNNVLEVEQGPEEKPFAAMARKILAPGFRHAAIAGALSNKMVGDSNLPGTMDYTRQLIADGDKAVAGDMEVVSRLLVSQAITLDTMFTEFVRRGAANMGDYPDAMDRYMRLALKAQVNSRQTLEALTKLHQPREQVVRHINVNEGGQAVIADNFHHHKGGLENARFGGQPLATEAAGTGPALPCPDAGGNGMPITEGDGLTTVPHARR